MIRAFKARTYFQNKPNLFDVNFTFLLVYQHLNITKKRYIIENYYMPLCSS